MQKYCTLSLINQGIQLSEVTSANVNQFVKLFNGEMLKNYTYIYSRCICTVTLQCGMSVCLLVMRVSSAKQPYRSKCCLGCVTAEPNKPLLGWSQILPRKGALLGVILGHEQTCPRLICSTLFARRQEQCGFWQPVYRSNLLYYTVNVRFHAFTAHLWAVHLCAHTRMPELTRSL